MDEKVRSNYSDENSEWVEKIVHVGRVAKVVKGGRRFSFSALVVVGNGQGQVGIGFGKAAEVPDAIRKATEKGKKYVSRVALAGGTIPYPVQSKFGSASVLLRPASDGTGVIAGSAVRSILEAVGIRDILTKSLGSNNPHNVVKAVFKGLISLRTPQEIYSRRGVSE